MKSKKVFISQDIFDYLDSEWKIKIPEEFKTGNYNHYQAEVQRCDFKMSGIRKGFKFSKKDFENLSILLSMSERKEDLLELSRIYMLQKDLPNILFELYDRNKKFKSIVDSNNLESVKKFLDNFYYQKYGKMTDEIIERDSLFILTESKNDEKRNSLIDDLLTDI